MKIRNLAVAFLCSLVLASVTFAQSSPTDHIFVTGSALAFNGPNGMTASSQFGAALQLTHRVSVGYEQVTIPGLNRAYRFGVANYTVGLNSLLGKSLSSRFVFDTSIINVTFQAGGGKVDQTAPRPVFSNVAETGGIFVSYPLASHVDYQVIGAQWLHGGSSPSNVALSTGLTFHF